MKINLYQMNYLCLVKNKFSPLFGKEVVVRIDGERHLIASLQSRRSSNNVTRSHLNVYLGEKLHLNIP